jgi:hypothetical protein
LGNGIKNKKGKYVKKKKKRGIFKKKKKLGKHLSDKKKEIK